MGLKTILGALFGGNRNVIAQTAEVFRENAEASAQRSSELSHAALAQFAAEFVHERRGRFDRFVDGLNRLPRPLIVILTFAFFGSAMFSPVWFAERMQGLILVPEPLWWLAGVIVTFYFGGRFQIKSQEFHRSITQTAGRLPQVVENLVQLRELRHDSPGIADTGTDADLAEEVLEPGDNPALAEAN